MRGESCGVVFYHQGRNMSVAVHGDDFACSALDEDLIWPRDLMAGWFDIKFRRIPVPDGWDHKEMTILGRFVRVTPEIIEYKADPKHRRLV